MEADKLDQGPDLRLRAAEKQAAATGPQAACEHRQVDHQRRVSERQLAKIDQHVRVGVDRARQGSSSAALGAPILIASALQGRGLVLEVDDPGNLYHRDGRRQGLQRLSYTWSMTSVEDVTDALRDVIDPELGLDFVELGLIYDVEIEDGTVRVTYTLTSPGCPIGPQVSEQIEEFVSELEGVEEVQPTMTFSPPWTPERMSEDAKFALGF
jgi:metal-sulfur cluster biosynthetic enzyme